MKKKDPYELAQKKWKSSGLTDAVAKKLRFEVLSAEQVKKLGSYFLQAGALRIPYWTPAGKPSSFYRVRYLETPAGSFAGTLAKPPRYAQPTGIVNEVYLPPLLDRTWEAVLADPKTTLYITEGELKAASACAHGFVCMALGGVDMWKAAKRGISVLAAIANAAWEGRRVVICFDSDAKRKFAIQRSISALGHHLQSQGAEVMVAALPDLAGRDKTGLDDYLVAKGVKALQKVFDDAQPFWPQEKCDDTGNAGRFARAALGQCLYAPEWETWLWWDGTRWKKDAFGRVYELAAEVAVGIAEEAARALASGDKEMHKRLSAHASYSRSHRGLTAMVAQAAKVRGDLKVSTDRFDTDEMLFNVKNGTLDLRTGDLRPHDCDDLITQVAPVEYDRGAKAPRWDQALKECLPDAEVRTFLQRWAGYTLTGSVREHKLLFAQGPGRNGKGLIVYTLAAMMGDYAGTAPEGLLIARKFDAHPTELTTLYRKRLMVASETKKGSRWNDARVKRLTGGDPITARGMYENDYTFNPTHKLWVLSNDRPRADSGDAAMWDRLKLIPFDVTFRDTTDSDPAHKDFPERDPSLDTKLAAELPGILAWAAEGCLQWQKYGLSEPDAIKAATAEYRTEQRELDPLTPFMESSGGLIEATTKLAEYVNRYNTWDRRQGPVLTSRDMGTQLRGRGYRVAKGSGNVTYIYLPAGAPKKSKAKGGATVTPIRQTGTTKTPKY